MPAPNVYFSGDKNADGGNGESLHIVPAQAGLPFLAYVGQGGPTREPPMQEPRKADIANRQGGLNASAFKAPIDPMSTDSGNEDE